MRRVHSFRLLSESLIVISLKTESLSYFFALYNDREEMFHLIIFVIGLPGFLHSQAIGNSQKGGFPDYAVLGPGPVLPESSPQSRGEKCGTILLDECLKDLQMFLRLTHLPFTSKNNELDELCSQAIHGYNCSADATTSNCLKEKDSEIVPLFIDMAQYTFLMLCGNGYDSRGYLEEAFLEHSECILEHKSDMECCAQETRLPDLPILRILEQSSKSLPERQILACCPVARYMKCATEVVNRYCGAAA
ncbi:hypothetical protein X975_05118, partial [Stegodyphus mimosarum]